MRCQNIELELSQRLWPGKFASIKSLHAVGLAFANKNVAIGQRQTHIAAVAISCKMREYTHTQLGELALR